MQKEMFGWCMRMCMGAPDVWRLHGNLSDRYSEELGEYVDVMPSTPIALEKTDNGWLLTTISGSKYLLTWCRFPEREAEFIADIRAAIEAKNWARH